MKKLVLILILSMSASAQPSLTASHIRFGTTLPSVCNPSTGDVFFKTTATIGQYQCLTTNTWTAVGSAGGAVAFSAITSGTNSTATMTVGTGGSLVRSGSGIIDANRINGTAFSGLATGLLK